MPNVPHLAREIANGKSEEGLMQEFKLSRETLDLIMASDMFQALVQEESVKIEGQADA